MLNALNKLAHFAIGGWCGWNYRNPASAVGCGLFIAYQVVEQNAIHDEAYGEMKEFAIGYGIGLSLRWLRDWKKPIPVELMDRVGICDVCGRDFEGGAYVGEDGIVVCEKCSDSPPEPGRLDIPATPPGAHGDAHVDAGADADALVSAAPPVTPGVWVCRHGCGYRPENAPPDDDKPCPADDEGFHRLVKHGESGW